ncbi:MAG: phosphotransferase [Pirellulaceae bacterium]
MLAEPLSVLSKFLPAGQIARIEPLTHSGWSGARIWRVWTNEGQMLCLRRWPPAHPSPERLQLIHAVLAHVADGGIDFVPVPLAAVGGQTFVEQAGHLWELTPWLPGKADSSASPNPVRLSAAMRALARFHRAAAGFSIAAGTAPAIVERLSLCRRLQAGGFAQLETHVGRGLSQELDQRARRILERTRDRLASLAARLGAFEQVAFPLQPAIRDIHREHMLYTEDEVTGLIDFGALRIDTPMADVARLVGSLVADDAAARQRALDAYATVRSLSEQDRRAIDLLDESNVVLSGLNWTGWLYVERRDMGNPAPIVRRLDEILGRLSH